MDILTIALAVIIVIAIAEAIYIIVKTQRKKMFEGENKLDEFLLRIHIVDAIRLGFGFIVGVFIFLLILSFLLFVLQTLRIPWSSLPFFLPAP